MIRTFEQAAESLRTIACDLQCFADDLDAAPKLPVITGPITIAEAVQTLNTVLGDDKAYYSVEMELTHQSHSGLIAVEWKIYDGKKSRHFTGATLAHAVDAVLRAYTPPGPVSLEDVQDALGHEPVAPEGTPSVKDIPF